MSSTRLRKKIPPRFAKLSAETIRALNWRYPNDPACEHSGQIKVVIQIIQRRNAYGGMVGKPQYRVDGYRCADCDAWVRI